MEQAIAFIGAGQMARALAAGFVQAGLISAGKILASDPAPTSREAFSAAVPGAKVGENNVELAGHARVLFLAVKPQQMSPLLAELRESVTADHLVISIAAGVSLSRLAEGLGPLPQLVRVMPNTPCLVGQSATGYCLGPGVSDADAVLVAKLLGSVGAAFPLEEKLLDAVTGLSGSGPAFVYLMIEALSDGGVRCGLPRSVAQTLAAQTVLGAAQMVVSTGEHPAVLKDRVASPGGTTIAGLQTLEEHAVRGALIAAVQAATQRSRELGQS